MTRDLRNVAASVRQRLNNLAKLGRARGQPSPWRPELRCSCWRTAIDASLDPRQLTRGLLYEVVVLFALVRGLFSARA